MKAEITPGQASDYTGYDAIDDSDAIREGVEAKGGTPVIPPRKNRKDAVPVDRFAYALRNRIERAINRLKNARRFATRYDKTADSYLGFVHIVSARIWFRSLST